MISKLRLEAEGTTLQEVLDDIEAATKAAKLPKDLHVHDEHYERVHDTCFKARRVYGRGPKPTPAAPSGAFQRFGGTSGYVNCDVRTSQNASAVTVT